MFRNYVKIAIRQLWKNKNFSVINILGLALGMSCSLLIILWVQDEKSVDAFHKNGNRLYRIYERNFADGKVSGGYYTPGPLAEELKRLFPEIEMSSAYLWPQNHTFSVDDKILKQNGNGADSDFFRIFSYPLLEGRPETALSGPKSIAISHNMATSFFGSPHNAMGKAIRFENKKDYKVTAVFENLPANVSEHFDFLLNWKAIVDEYDWAGSWDDNDPFTYVLLRSNANPDLVEKKIMNLLGHHRDYYNKAFRSELHLQQFGDSYLHGNFSNGKIDGGRVEYIRIFSLIAIFILLIACINFMNLTSAHSLKRAREVGIRKVMGAERCSLMFQFISEAISVAFLSSFVALLIVWLALPSFNLLTEKQITLPYANWSFWAILTVLCLVTGLISGSYPSLLLSSFNPVRVLKANAVKLNTGSLLFRKGLVIFQFTLSIILIISTIFISRQVRYVQETNLGYDRDNLIYIPLEGELSRNLDVFKSEALRFSGVTSVSAVNLSPTNLQNGTMGIDWPGKDPNSKPSFAQIAVNYDFIKTMKLQMANGRDFSKDFATDSAGYIINQAAATTIGYKDPLGKPLTFWGKSGQIIGVVRDFHFQSFHQSIR
ncbi:MAG TPA: ABC transporter permease, partial [Puia sp.]|nr:ABC transporter permease [Puia sp.]